MTGYLLYVDSVLLFQVAIADHDGILTCFGIKKGEAVVGDLYKNILIFVCIVNSKAHILLFFFLLFHYYWK